MFINVNTIIKNMEKLQTMTTRKTLASVPPIDIVLSVPEKLQD